MSGLTETLARFAAAPGLDPLPSEAADIVRNGFIDAVATMVAGRDEPVVSIARRHVAARQPSARESSLLLGPGRAAAMDAALVNATAGHALDFDDVALGGHPSVVLVPAVLAEAEAVGASGAQVMRAYLVGYEAWAELVGRERDSHHLKGWHPTPVFGTVGAAAAVASLRALAPEACRNAISLAASMAAGLVANFGTMAKPLHAGRAACAGIEAVRLAALGASAAPDAIEHHAGFLAAISPQGRVDFERPAVDLGRSLRIVASGLSVKRYPICYATHRVIDAVIDMARSENLRQDDVDSVHATIGVSQASMLRNHAPTTGLEAKFSLEFAVASSLVARAVGLGQLTDEFVNRPDVRAAMSKVEISTVEAVCPIEPTFAYSDRVRLRLKDGRTLDSGEIRFARGNARLPLRAEELREKFLDCTRGAAYLDAGALYARLRALESVDDVRALAAA